MRSLASRRRRAGYWLSQRRWSNRCLLRRNWKKSWKMKQRNKNRAAIRPRLLPLRFPPLVNTVSLLVIASLHYRSRTSSAPPSTSTNPFRQHSICSFDSFKVVTWKSKGHRQAAAGGSRRPHFATCFSYFDRKKPPRSSDWINFDCRQQ